MIRFLLKGILRDKSRSFLPIVIITIGVSLTVLLSGYMKGVMGDLIDQSARFDTGHLKVMTRAYNINKDQLPNDLALLDVNELVQSLSATFPDVQWVKRIKFGGILDVPDAQGQTTGQGPATGMALEILSGRSGELERLNILSSMVTGAVPKKPGEVIVGHDFAEKLKLKVGDEITYFGSTMNGSMAFKNFSICGTIRFGTAAMDRGALIIDIADAQEMLDMENGVGEVLGFLNGGVYSDERATIISEQFNADFVNNTDEFAPIMLRLKDQNGLSDYLDYVDMFSGLFVAIFVMAMSVVLWNTGLLGGLRRYKEFGIRLALGESKGQIYRSLIYEAFLIGAIGSVVGTIIGVSVTLYLQVYGIDISGALSNSSMMMPSVLRAKFTINLLYIGFIPGLFAMMLGNMLSGIGVYKRETATLFKELEV
ncbi:MAG: FtsX-like permease family protein [Imperialibacter sp.]|uniref:ABC transporter permease n=1 Tax=Imperialibacter sp. TaxID=2038411 RepID=UPI0032EC7B50